MKIFIRILLSIVGVIILLIVGLMIYEHTYYKPFKDYKVNNDMKVVLKHKGKAYLLNDVNMLPKIELQNTVFETILLENETFDENFNGSFLFISKNNQWIEKKYFLIKQFDSKKFISYFTPIKIEHFNTNNYEELLAFEEELKKNKNIIILNESRKDKKALGGFVIHPEKNTTVFEFKESLKDSSYNKNYKSNFNDYYYKLLYLKD